MTNNDYTLIDDGTLDTVLECNTCGEVIRCNPEGETRAERIEDAIDSADDHDCTC